MSDFDWGDGTAAISFHALSPPVLAQGVAEVFANLVFANAVMNVPIAEPLPILA